MVITALQHDTDQRRRRTRPATRRLTWRDRTWLRFTTVRAAGPLDLPSAAVIRRALARLHARDPWHPMLCRIDVAQGRLIAVPDAELPGLLDEIVLDGDAGSPTELAERLMARPGDDLACCLLLGGTSVALRTAHVVGDGSVTNDWFRQLLMITDDQHELPGRRDVRFPLLRAIWGQLLRQPRHAITAARTSLPLAPPAGPPAPMITTGSPSLVWGRMAPAQLDRLRGWRDDHCPDASVAAVTMAATLQALSDHGLGADGVFVMMDCRRYLPRGSSVTGNFATGPYLTPTDATDPGQLGRELAAAARTGVPLLLLGLLTLRNVLRGGHTAPPSAVRRGSSPRTTLSHQGRLDVDELPWTAAGRAGAAEYLTAPTPSGPAGITLTYAASRFGLHVSGTLHPEVLDPAALRAALRSLELDPVSLLDR